MEKLYVVVRSDMKPGLQLAQACHAVQAMNDQHSEVIQEWEGNIAIVSAKNKQHLSELMCELQRRKVPLAVFCEPDEGGDLTAMAVHGKARRALSSLPLALKRPSAVSTGGEVEPAAESHPPCYLMKAKERISS